MFGLPIADENPRHRVPYVTWGLIAACTAVFFLSLVNFESTIATFGFTPTAFSIVTLFTCMFLHGGIAHIAGNMWYLYLFGDNVEDTFGPVLFLGFYLVSGVVATLTHYVLNSGSSIPTVGASGAISGVMGAYLVLFPHVQVKVLGRTGVGLISAWVLLAAWFAAQFFGVFGADSGVAFWAHIGGFVAGAGSALIYKLARK